MKKRKAGDPIGINVADMLTIVLTSTGAVFAAPMGRTALLAKFSAQDPAARSGGALETIDMSSTSTEA